VRISGTGGRRSRRRAATLLDLPVKFNNNSKHDPHRRAFVDRNGLGSLPLMSEPARTAVY
jgi:hypothetical protein